MSIAIDSPVIAVKELVRTWGAGVKPLAGGAAPTPIPSVLINSTKANESYRTRLEVSLSSVAHKQRGQSYLFL
jgi:hypothetical protein